MESAVTEGVNDLYFVHQFVGCSGLCFVLKTLVQALRHCTGPRTHRGCRGIALLFLDRGTRRGEGSASRSGRLYPRERPGIHCKGD